MAAPSRVRSPTSTRCLVAVLLLMMTAVGGELRVNKCCAGNEEMDDWLRVCVAVDDTPDSEVSTEQTTIVPTTVPSANSSFPWWMDPNSTALDAKAWAGAQVRYGHRPCNFSGTQFVFSHKRDSYELLANGSLVLPVWTTNDTGQGRLRTKVAFSPEEWCADRVQGRSFVFLVCPCGRVTCLNRCCNRNAMYLAEKQRHVISANCKKVVNGSVHAPNPAFHSGRSPLREGDGGGVVYTELNAHTIDCDKAQYAKYLLKSLADDARRSFWLQRNGSVVIENYHNDKAFPQTHVCLVEVLQEDGRVEPDLFFCIERTKKEAPGQENVYYSLLFLSGSFFLLLTLLVHALVPELRRSAHAKALMCHCATLLTASVTLTVGHLRRRTTQPSCSISAFVVQYSFLSTFFWLNVMCFDLSWTFGAMRQRVPSGNRQSRRFLWYSLYAWGCPALITAVTLFMEYASVVPQDLWLLPNIGARRCWFDTKMTTFVYYYGPMALLLAVNLALFAFTILRIQNSRRGTSILRKGSANARTHGGGAGSSASGGDVEGSSEAAGAPPQKKTSMASATSAASSSAPSGRQGPKSGDRQMLVVFTKLFCLMGVTWVTEIVSWLAGEESFAFWYITDAINLLRGVLIFVFFCCKPTALRPLRARLRVCERRFCPQLLRRRVKSGRSIGASISTQESSLSMPEMGDAAATAIGPAAPAALNSLNDAVRDNAL